MDYIVRLVNMPPKIRSFVRENDDGCSATIVINARLSHENQLMRYKHEVDHISNNDLQNDEDANRVEYEAHERSK